MILWLFFVGVMAVLAFAYQVGDAPPSSPLAWIAHIAFFASMVVWVGGSP